MCVLWVVFILPFMGASYNNSWLMQAPWDASLRSTDIAKVDLNIASLIEENTIHTHTHRQQLNGNPSSAMVHVPRARPEFLAVGGHNPGFFDLLASHAFVTPW